MVMNILAVIGASLLLCLRKPLIKQSVVKKTTEKNNFLNYQLKLQNRVSMLSMASLTLLQRHAQTQHSSLDEENIVLCKASFTLPAKAVLEEVLVNNVESQRSTYAGRKSQENVIEKVIDPCTTLTIEPASPQCVWFYEVQLPASENEKYVWRKYY
uniref:Uncharacterized protein n=1 Tax=Glossina palpalis gambiensis TaxID=67801 RepID=A0A1B0C243_9MUSC